MVPRHGEGGRLARAFAEGAREALAPRSLGIAFCAAVLATCILRIPVAGVWLFGGLLSAGAWVFQGVIRQGGAAGSGEGRARKAIRLGLSFLAALVILAPFYLRNGGAAVPEGPALGGEWGLGAALLAWWVALPLVLAVVNGQDRAGPVAPRQVGARLLARPWCTLAALLVVPVGLLAVELGLAFVAIEQLQMPLLLNDLFPRPTITHKNSLVHLVYRYDGCVWDIPFTGSGLELVPVYLSALRRGYTLLGEVPGSLTLWVPRFDPTIYQTRDSVYFAVRFVLSIMGLAGAFSVLGIQARCLGRLVADDVGVERAALRTGATAFPSVAAAVRAGGPEPSRAPLPPPPASASEARARPAIRPPSVLIVDDEAQCAQTLARILADEGLLVATAANARDGLALASSARPDLIILDLLLPDCSGLEVCRTLRAQAATRDIPVLMLTYRDSVKDEVSGLEQGADDYVAKPYVVEVLLARIRKQVRGRPIGPEVPFRQTEPLDIGATLLVGR